MKYVDPGIIEVPQSVCVVIDCKIVLHITPGFRYDHTTRFNTDEYYALRLFYIDGTDDLFLFQKEEKRDKLRDLLETMQMLRYRVPDSEWPSYTYTVTVRPCLTEHEGFDPEYVRDKVERLILAGCDKDFSEVVVTRT
jgi:hypothetical protein